MNGIINLLKPPGMSSNGAVVYIRRLTGIKKAGHIGTLDPNAAGLLVIMLGKATKLSSRLMGMPKAYVAEIAFGKATDTQDSYGNIVDAKEGAVTAEALKEALRDFTGEILQTPPAYSAVHYRGERMYRLARKGVLPDIKQRKVHVYDAKFLTQTGDNRFLFQIRCGKGVYIRTLCHDIGKKLGIPAYLSLLVRTENAGFGIAGAVTLTELEALVSRGELARAVYPVGAVLEGYEAIIFPDRMHTLLLNGNTVPFNANISNTVYRHDKEYRVQVGEKLIGIGKPKGDRIKISVLLAAGKADE